MNEFLRVAAWLDANAKHMKYEDERAQMHKAAKIIRTLEKEVQSDLEALQKAHEMLAEMKSFIQEAAGVQEQKVVRDTPRITMSNLWR